MKSYHPEVELRSGLNAAIAVPKGDGPFPVFVITHGPGLTAGSSRQYRYLTQFIASHGYVTVTPDFRLAPEHPFPAGFDDMRFALEWARDNAHDWNADPSRIVLWGDSLGAALALGLLLDLQDRPGAPRVSAFVGSEGEYDLSAPAMANGNSVKWYPGEGGKAVLTDRRVSPLLHIARGAKLPPLLLVTGSAGATLTATLDLARKLHEEDVEFQLHTIAGMGHDFMKFPELEGMREAHELMFDFLSRVV
ncbi:alpha/beta hydrolase [Subtercola sp. YIM 133946]|uniref:alpha/beta hydrolase n=1 Tax=Subtercola sp. YIM 133946 TaxID=3118909 RepID=UPI002F95F8AC